MNFNNETKRISTIRNISCIGCDILEACVSSKPYSSRNTRVELERVHVIITAKFKSFPIYIVNLASHLFKGGKLVEGAEI